MLKELWPVAERPREKLLKNGASILTDAELIAIFLGTGTRSQSVLSLASDLLKSTGGIRPLLELDFEDMLNFQGVGQAKFVILKAALE